MSMCMSGLMEAMDFEDSRDMVEDVSIEFNIRLPVEMKPEVQKLSEDVHDVLAGNKDYVDSNLLLNNADGMYIFADMIHMADKNTAFELLKQIAELASAVIEEHVEKV